MNSGSFPSVLSEILKNRGVRTTREIDKFLYPTISHLSDPFSIVQMQDACKIIEDVIYKKKKIFIYADGDVDGIAGTAMLVSLFRNTNVHFDLRITHRLESYEIAPSFIDKIKNLGYEVLITVDTGSSSYDLIEYCEKNCFPLIIIDHHKGNIKGDFDYVTIVNPSFNRGDRELDFLTASGIVFKLIQSLRMVLPFFPEQEFFRYLELAAIGTLADYGLLVDENRLIVKIALSFFENTHISGIEALKKYFYVPRKQGDIEPITHHLNPKLNTPGRFGKPELALRILTANENDDLLPVLQEIERMEKEKQNIFRKLNDAIAKIKGDGTYFLIFEGIPCSFSGPFAARLSEKIQAPALVAMKKDDIIQGSARGYGRTDLYEIFQKHKSLFLSFGGHKNAVGFRLKSSFLNELSSIWNDEMRINSVKNVQKNDLIRITFDILTVHFIETLELMKPFGPGNPRVFFTTSNVQCLKITRYQKNKIVAWVKQNDKMFEAHFPKTFKMPSEPFSIIYTPVIRKSNEFYVIWLDVRDFSEVF